MQLAKREMLKSPIARHGLVVLGIGLLFGFLGPFGSYPALDRSVRYGFWLFLIGFGYLSVLLVSEAANRSPRLNGRSAATRLGIVAISSAVPLTFATSWTLSQVQPGRATSAAELPMLLIAVAAVQLILSLVVFGLEGQWRPAPVAAAPRPERGRTDRILERLPPHLRDELIAVEAQDHYLRVHTRAGSALILSRLSDVLAELDGVEGLQVHRGWWVAAGAVSGIQRDGSRTWLLLSNGVRAPVSRTYLRAVRAHHWPTASQPA